MTKYSTAECDDARARNQAVEEAIAKHAGWSLQRPLHLPPGISRRMFYVFEADLLLSATQDAPRPDSLVRAMKTSRCDVLSVAVGMNGDCPEGVLGLVGIWSRTGIRRHEELRAWCSASGDLWMASELHVHADDQAAFLLSPRRFRMSALPWSTSAEGAAGFQRADELLLASGMAK